MKKVLLIFIIYSILEFFTFSIIGQKIGLFNTILLLVLIGILGAMIAKRQGLQAMQRASEQMQNGLPPGDSILDGICILFGSILLILPGFLSDFISLVFLVPLTRRLVKPMMLYFLAKWFAKGNVTYYR